MVPPCILRGSPKVGRLFENYERVEKDYFLKTGIFPIVHFIALQRELYRRHRWVAQSLYKAFKDARSRALDFYRMQDGIMHRLFMLPWLSAHQKEIRDVMGDDWWPYGVERNRKTLEAFLRYHHEQGFSARRLNPEDLFAPETLLDHSRFG
jgi:4,5-dihydroxyphthalate decarboxylase